MSKNTKQIYNEYSTLEDEGFPRYSNQELISSKIRNENKGLLILFLLNYCQD